MKTTYCLRCGLVLDGGHERDSSDKCICPLTDDEPCDTCGHKEWHHNGPCTAYSKILIKCKCPGYIKHEG